MLILHRASIETAESKLKIIGSDSDLKDHHMRPDRPYRMSSLQVYRATCPLVKALHTVTGNHAKKGQLVLPEKGKSQLVLLNHFENSPLVVGAGEEVLEDLALRQHRVAAHAVHEALQLVHPVLDELLLVAT